MASTDEQFIQAVHSWDVETLYTDLASAKGKRLTPVEKLHLRGLLCGYSPAEIAEKLGKSVKGVEVEFCNSLYQYSTLSNDLVQLKSPSPSLGEGFGVRALYQIDGQTAVCEASCGQAG